MGKRTTAIQSSHLLVKVAGDTADNGYGIWINPVKVVIRSEAARNIKEIKIAVEQLKAFGWSQLCSRGT